MAMHVLELRRPNSKRPTSQGSAAMKCVSQNSAVSLRVMLSGTDPHRPYCLRFASCGSLCGSLPVNLIFAIGICASYCCQVRWRRLHSSLLTKVPSIICKFKASRDEGAVSEPKEHPWDVKARQ